MELTIIVVNYKSIQLIEALLESLNSNESKIGEILIIDNSGDDPTQLLHQFPNLRWVPMGYNAGFARANNKGIELASFDTILLLNPDILIEDDSISRCYNQFRCDPYVACGVQLLNTDRSPQISGSYFMKGALNLLLPLPFLGNFLKSIAGRVNMRKPSIDEVKGVQEVDWINGAFLMVKKEVLPKAGLLDEDFFLYAEEIEWCARLRKTGRLCIYGNEHVIHLQGETANESFGSEGKGYYNLYDKKGRQLMVSNFLRVRKQYGSGWLLFHTLMFALSIPIFFFGWAVQKMTAAKRRYRFAQFQGYCRNFFYLLSLAPAMIRNKPRFYKAI